MELYAIQKGNSSSKARSADGPTGKRHSSQEISEVMGNEREEHRGSDHDVPVEGQCGDETPVKKSRKSARASTGGACGELKQMPPQAKIRPLREPLRWHEHECPQHYHQNGPARYALGENGHHPPYSLPGGSRPNFQFPISSFQPYIRSARPWASGTLFKATRTMSTSFQIPQPPRVASFRIPRPVYPR